ncbi:MAG: hypothetical protein AAF603_03920 [Pseudomonadota bacterium]
MSLASRDLLQVSQDLLAVKNLTDSHISRAVSTSYYAIFQHVCCAGGDLLTGNANKNYLKRAKEHLQRSIDHKSLAKRCIEAQNPKLEFPREIVEFCNALYTAQELRIQADYNTYRRISKIDATTLLGQVKDAMDGFDSLQKKHKIAFLIWALLEKRK